ncbi:MAG: peptidylprolyl isomerase [Akkermansiaceae bacterium]|nr:peptidylprolyl isomerase [Akkermansiaceae bacterium]
MKTINSSALIGKGPSHPKRRFAALWAMGMVLLVAGCGGPKKEDASVLAKVGDREFRIADLDAEIARRTAARRPIPALPELLAEMVDYELLLQSARTAGLENDPEVRRTYHNLLIGAYKENELRPLLDAAVVSEAEVAAWYDANPERYRTEERARFGVIFVAVDPHASAENRRTLRERADEARTLALADEGRGFVKAATRFSDDQSSRYKGGDIGWIKQGGANSRIPHSVIEVGFGLTAEDVSGVIETKEGYYLTKLLGQEPESQVPLEQVRGSIKAQLLLEKLAAITMEFQRSIRDRVGTEVFAARLSEIAASRGVAETPEPVPPAL